MPALQDAYYSQTLLLDDIPSRIFELNDALKLDRSQLNSKAYYKKLIDEVMTVWDVLPCLGTVGANLTQNIFFLFKQIDALYPDKTVNITLKILAVIIDVPATGASNMFQRFWTSVQFAWIERLPKYTKHFIKALHTHLKNNKLKKLLVSITSEDMEAIIKEETQSSYLLFKSDSTLTLSQALLLLSMFYKIEIQLSPLENSMHDEENQKQEKSFFRYAPHQYTLYGFARELHPFNLYCHVFLNSIPCLMLCFQTVSMLSGTVPEGKMTLPLANFLCFAAILFGLGKWIVNNTLRWDLAVKTFAAMCTLKYWSAAAKFLFHEVIGEFFYGFLLLCQGSGSLSLSYLLPALINFSGIFLGLSITLFYLDVGLYTKDGIQFTLDTLISDVDRDSKPMISYYEKLHTPIDICCGIASLSFNGLLTQMQEAIGKCYRLSKESKKYFNPPKSKKFNVFDIDTTEKESKKKVPCLMHLANFLDICVFTISAYTAIQDLLNKASGMKGRYSQPLNTITLSLNYIHYALLCSGGAGFSNLGFIYFAAAKNQGYAWSYLGQKLGIFKTPALSGQDSTGSLSRLTDSSSRSTLSNPPSPMMGV